MAMFVGLIGVGKNNRALRNRNAMLEAEAIRLREEFGFLTVDDVTRFYAIRVPETRGNLWTYRVYLPPGDEYFVACRLNNLPARGDKITVSRPPDTNTIKSVQFGSAFGLESGEHLLVFSVRKEDGNWKYTMKSHDGTTTGSEIRCKDDEWPAVRQSMLGLAISGVGNTTFASDLDEPVRLLELRTMPTPEPGSSANSGDSPNGVVLWIDRVSNYRDG